jgi:hypothetical protein
LTRRLLHTVTLQDPNAGKQFIDAEWLGDEIIGTKVERAHAAVGLGHHIACGSEANAKRVSHGWLIIDDEDAWGKGLHFHDGSSS